ncbi:hypothetical protein [Acutalibacter muris]|uniref:hypothetical protein n=1 Tax=Acutalibacter muris TaxID=1796620 RepID=UPI00272E29CC|nr:hypothetical protein [Acutalibacter muris]
MHTAVEYRTAVGGYFPQVYVPLQSQEVYGVQKFILSHTVLLQHILDAGELIVLVPQDIDGTQHPAIIAYKVARPQALPVNAVHASFPPCFMARSKIMSIFISILENSRIKSSFVKYVCMMVFISALS